MHDAMLFMVFQKMLNCKFITKYSTNIELYCMTVAVSVVSEKLVRNCMTIVQWLFVTKYEGHVSKQRPGESVSMLFILYMFLYSSCCTMSMYYFIIMRTPPTCFKKQKT